MNGLSSSSPVTSADGLEIVRRIAADSAGSFLFLLNHSNQDMTAQATGTDLITGDSVTGTVTVPARGLAIVAEG